MTINWWWRLCVCWFPFCKMKVLDPCCLSNIEPDAGYNYKWILCLWYFTYVGTALDEALLDALGILPRRKRHKKLLLVCPYASADLNTSVVDMLWVSKLEDMFFASRELGHSLRSYMNWTQFQIIRATAVAQWDGIHVRHVIGNEFQKLLSIFSSSRWWSSFVVIYMTSIWDCMDVHHV